MQLISRSRGVRGVLTKVVVMAAAVCGTASAQIRITEYMYSANGSEFIELTNLGVAPVDMTGWSMDDSSATAGSFDLSGFGTVAAGETIIITEDPSAANFRTVWGLDPAVKVVEALDHNLGRNDEINIYDNTSALVDVLTYGDQDFPGTIRTQDFSGWPCAPVVGTNDIFGWVLAFEGDLQGSYASTDGDVGNPGVYISANPCVQMRITEYMYSGNGGEFIEFTNIGSTTVDMTGFVFNDGNATPEPFSLSGFGNVLPGESVILTEDPVATFESDWGLSGVSIVGLLGDTEGNNIGRNDTIKLEDASGAIVDRLDYGDQDFPGSFRTQEFSASPCQDGVGVNNIYLWIGAMDGDAHGSFESGLLDTGNPGSFVDDVTCPVLTGGACCTGGVCTEGPEPDCIGVGIYQGDGTVCIGKDAVTCPAPSGAEIRITEFMSGGTGGEFVEFTNVGGVPVDMTGWSYSDEAAVPGNVDLSAFGTVAAGESFILSEAVSVSEFETHWGLTPGVVNIIAGNNVNINGEDEIVLFDNSATVVDRIDFGVEQFPNSVDADGVSAWVCSQGLGLNQIYDWRLSEIADNQGSFLAPGGDDVGNPGMHTDRACAAQSGSCCDGVVCDNLSPEACAGNNGVYLGNGTNCIANPCPQGACCTAGSCDDLAPGACAIADGLYLGDDTSCLIDGCPAPSDGVIRITEYMYTGTGGEFVEFTNLGDDPVDMTGWSFADSSSAPGLVDLSGFGVVNPGEVVIMTEDDPAQFAADWGGLTNDIVMEADGELGRNDTIRLFDSSGTLVDVLQYGDEDIPGSIRTNDISGWPCEFAIGNDNILGWVLSDFPDAQGSFVNVNGDTGNPGSFVIDNCGQPAIPTVSEWGLLCMGILFLTAGTIVYRRWQPVATS
jgi:hypothetical protein